MKEKLISWLNSRNYTSHMMRMLVGGYIAYLGIDIFLDMYKSGEYTIPLCLFGGIMILCGAPIAVISLYGVTSGYSKEYKGKIVPREDEEQ